MKGKSIRAAAASCGIGERTARKYSKLGKLPSQLITPRDYSTRQDPFSEVWDWVRKFLTGNSGLRAITLFMALQRDYPGKFQDGQLRTLQRKIRRWKAEEGPPKEIFFPQVHKPGDLAASDFTRMNKLRITIQGRPFEHLLYHFILTYSNWETVTICFSESFESFSTGLQNALWELGGVPLRHRKDRLSAAIINPRDKKKEKASVTQAYGAFLRHYGFSSSPTNPASPHENGDIEQRHYRLKDAIDQKLMLRGSRDFASREEYEGFLRETVRELNMGRQKRLLEELKVLKKLPARRLEDFKRKKPKVGISSTIRVNNNGYSVPSRLRGEEVEVRVYMDHLEVWYGQKKMQAMPRLRGENNYLINYRHVIDGLVRKPGAFRNYQHKNQMFPTSHFRMAYDWLLEHSPAKADKEYLKILYLAAREGESLVDGILRCLISETASIGSVEVKKRLECGNKIPSPLEINVDQVNLETYDSLLMEEIRIVKEAVPV